MAESGPKTVGRRRILVWLLLAFISVAPVGHAQFGGTSIAQTLTISSGTPASGDLVAYDRSGQSYYITDKQNDPGLYGVIVAKPLIVLRGATGGVPVVTSGQAVVNVTNAAGPISVGDYLTSSNVLGRAQKASLSDLYVIGVALQSFTAGTSTNDGSILVALNFARRPLFSSATASSSAVTSAQSLPKAPAPTVPTVQVLRYLLAALIAVGSVYAAFRNFGANITSGIVSIGRNPLAKSSIQLMVALNAALIVFISMLGLFVALVVVLMPL